MRLLILLACAAMAMAQATPKGLIGRWRTENISADGIGALYVFSPGGVVQVSTGPIAPGTYKVEGNYVVLPSMLKGGPANRMLMDFSKPGMLELKSNGQTVVEVSRVGGTPPGPPKLEGIWMGAQELKGKKNLTTYIFNADGTCFFYMIFETARASYVIEGEKMTIRFPNGKQAQGPFSIQGGKLMIPSLKAGATTTLLPY